MAPVGWFTYQRWDEIPIGIFTSETLAKNAADDGADGEYVLIPIEPNQSYDDLIDEDLPGALIYRSQGLEARVATLESQIALAQTAFQNLSDEVDTFKTQAQSAVQNLNDLIVALDARVTALEGG